MAKIAKAGKPMVRLVPVASVKTPRKGFASLKGKIRIHEDFDAPLSPQMLRAFGMK